MQLSTHIHVHMYQIPIEGLLSTAQQSFLLKQQPQEVERTGISPSLPPHVLLQAVPGLQGLLQGNSIQRGSVAAEYEPWVHGSQRGADPIPVAGTALGLGAPGGGGGTRRGTKGKHQEGGGAQTLVNPLPTLDAPMRHDLSELSISLWEFIWGFNTRRYTSVHGFCFF